MDEEHRWPAIVGIIIVVIVGLNIIFVFSDMLNIGRGSGLITSFSILECRNSAEGIICGEDVYPNADWTGCPSGSTIVCTNSCEITRIKMNDDRVCPSYCTDFCVSPDLAELIFKQK